MIKHYLVKQHSIKWCYGLSFYTALITKHTIRENFYNVIYRGSHYFHISCTHFQISSISFWSTPKLTYEVSTCFIPFSSICQFYQVGFCHLYLRLYFWFFEFQLGASKLPVIMSLDLLIPPLFVLHNSSQS